MKKLDPFLLDTKTTLVNLANSILKHYGITPFHATIPEVDEMLKGHDKIAVFLFDGAGEYVLKQYPHTCKDLLSHHKMTLHAVNPATTVASTTSFLTAKFPIETGWLGWSLYFEELGIPVEVYTNRNYLTHDKLPERIMEPRCPAVFLDSLLNSNGVKAERIYEYGVAGNTVGPKTYKEYVARADKFFAEGGQFLYNYWSEPDHALHDKGVHSHVVRKHLRGAVKAVKAFAKHHPDVLLLVIADHGLIDANYRDIAAFPELAETLARPLSIEGRCASIAVKDGMDEQFLAAMKKYFPDFVVMSRQEVLDSHFFGEGEPHPYSLGFIGDYIALSLGNDLLVNTNDIKEPHVLRAHHAGGKIEEKAINLAVYNL